MSMERSHSLMRLSRIKLLFKSTDPEFPLLLSESILLPAMATYSLLQTGEKIKDCMFLTKKLPVHVRYCDVWQNWPVFSWWGKPHYQGHRLHLFLENWLSWTFHPFYGLSVMLHCSHHFFKPLCCSSSSINHTTVIFNPNLCHPCNLLNQLQSDDLLNKADGPAFSVSSIVIW